MAISTQTVLPRRAACGRWSSQAIRPCLAVTALATLLAAQAAPHGAGRS